MTDPLARWIAESRDWPYTEMVWRSDSAPAVPFPSDAKRTEPWLVAWLYRDHELRRFCVERDPRWVFHLHVVAAGDAPRAYDAHTHDVSRDVFAGAQRWRLREQRGGGMRWWQTHWHFSMGRVSCEIAVAQLLDYLENNPDASPRP